MGLRFGLGFAIPFLLLYIICAMAVNVGNTLVQENMFDTIEGEAFGPHSGLHIAHQERDNAREGYVVRGRVENRGTSAWNLVRLQVDVINADGQFVGLCEGRVNGSISAGKGRYFVVECDDDVLVSAEGNLEHSIDIVGAFHMSIENNDK
jgi:hypothetical protein